MHYRQKGCKTTFLFYKLEQLKEGKDSKGLGLILQALTSLPCLSTSLSQKGALFNLQSKPASRAVSQLPQSLKVSEVQDKALGNKRLSPPPHPNIRPYPGHMVFITSQ